MIIFSAIIMAVCLVGDLILEWPLGSIILKLQLTHLFLYYLLFRKPFKHVLFILFFYLVLIMPFTGLPLIPVFVSLFFVMFVIHKAREQIYTESYLVMAIWVGIMNVLQQLLLTILAMQNWKLLVASLIFVNILINAGLLMLLTIPFFMNFDKWYVKAQRVLYGRKDIDPADSLRQNRYGDYL